MKTPPITGRIVNDKNFIAFQGDLYILISTIVHYKYKEPTPPSNTYPNNPDTAYIKVQN